MFMEDKTLNPGVKADPFSLESLIAWMRGKSANETYCFMDTGHCLLGQFFSAAGYNEVIVGGTFVMLGDTCEELPLEFRKIARGYPHTFGAAIERAMALQATSSGPSGLSGSPLNK